MCNSTRLLKLGDPFMYACRIGKLPVQDLVTAPTDFSAGCTPRDYVARTAANGSTPVARRAGT